MELPKEPIPYDVLLRHVNDLHLHSPIQRPTENDLTTNCTTFATSLTTDLVAKYFPNGSHLAGQLPHRIQYSPQAHLNIITPSDRVQLSLGCVRHDFETLKDLVDHVADPNNGVIVATVDGSDHAFNVVRTDQGVKIADAQYGFVCDFEDWEQILKVASGDQERFVGGHFGMMNISEHDPMFVHHLQNFDNAMAHFSTAPKVVEKIQEKIGEHFGASRNTATVIFTSVTDPELLASVDDFELVGNRYTENPQYPGQTTAIDINSKDLDLKPGDWVAARDEYGEPIMLMGTKDGICYMRVDPHRTTHTNREVDEDLHVLASSASIDLKGHERTPYTLINRDLKLHKEITFTNNARQQMGFER